MQIKGSFFAARRQSILREYGEARWAEIDAILRRRSPTFNRLITPASRVEDRDYVLFQETILQQLHGGDERAYWEMGRRSAAWALTEGPYAHLLNGTQRGVATVESTMTRLWRVYSDEGTFTVDFADDAFTVVVGDVSFWHASIEYASMGYGEQTIELALQRSVRHRRLYGAKEGRMGCSYRFELGQALPST